MICILSVFVRRGTRSARPARPPSPPTALWSQSLGKLSLRRANSAQASFQTKTQMTCLLKWDDPEATANNLITSNYVEVTNRLLIDARSSPNTQRNVHICQNQVVFQYFIGLGTRQLCWDCSRAQGECRSETGKAVLALDVEFRSLLKLQTDDET